MRSPPPSAAPRSLCSPAILLVPTSALADRVRDLGAFQGVRTNQLTVLTASLSALPARA